MYTVYFIDYLSNMYDMHVSEMLCIKQQKERYTFNETNVPD